MFSGISIVTVAYVILAIFGYGCASQPSGQRQCSTPEKVFGHYVDRDLGEHGATVVRKCRRSLTEDTGDVIVTCRIQTKTHGIIHKRLPERTCWE